MIPAPGSATPGILVVDDTPENLRLLVHGLGAAGYRVRAAPHGELALRMARAETPDLVLLDVDMPGLDGYAVCEIMQREPALQPVPILFISAIHDVQAKVKALRIGGRDYVTKPFNMEEVLARVATHVELRRLNRALAASSERLEQQVAAQVHEISEAQHATIVALAKLAESRDDATGLHVVRMAAIARTVAEAARHLGVPECGQDSLSLDVFARAATLHDIGKVGIPDAVLLKPGKLLPEELAIMKTHTVIGSDTLDAVHREYPRNALVRVAAQIARSHHERFDGRGYPDGLAGRAIPMAARLAAVADVYDAVRSARPYKPALPHEETARIVIEGRGTQFDPDVVDAFASIAERVDRIWCDMQSTQQQRSNPG